MKPNRSAKFVWLAAIAAFPALLWAQTSPSAQSQTATPAAAQPQARAQSPAAGPAATAATSAAGPSTPAAQPANATLLSLPAGAALHVRLTTTLTSKTNKTGDPFTGVLEKPVTVGDKTVVPEGSLVAGHVALIKPSGRIKAKAQMRIVLDSIDTPDDVSYKLAAGLDDAQGSPCAKTGTDNEGTMQGCGKSKKDAAKDSAIGAAMGAGVGATVGLGHEIDCEYYGNCGGPGMGTDVLAGAGIGAGTALIYNLFKHEKELILIEGSDLTFIVNRTVEGTQGTPDPEANVQVE